MKIIFIGATKPEFELWCPNFMGVKSGLKSLGVEYAFLNCRANPNLLQDVKDFGKVDLIIYGLKDLILDSELRHQIRKLHPEAKIVFWYGDLRNETTGQIYMKLDTTLDAMFVSNDGQKQFYKEHFNLDNVYFLPLGCNTIPAPVVNPKFNFDFVFIGSKNHSTAFFPRAKMISQFEIQGLKVIDSQRNDLRLKIYKAMPEIYSSSKVVLDVSHFTDIPKYTSVRYWEIPAFWGFALTKRFPGCEEFYPENTHRIYWDTFDEAVEKRDYYINHEKERQEIIQRAWAHTRDNHTHAHRFLQMFKALGIEKLL